MKYSFRIKHLIARFRRFQHRRGYGVHSPFAFDFITYVIYEHSPYYAYKELQEKENKLKINQPRGWLNESLHLRRLLFRLSNYVRPNTIVDIGQPSASSLYLQRGSQKATYHTILDTNADVSITLPALVYIRCWHKPDSVEYLFHSIVEKIDCHSLIIIQGIGYSKEMKSLWKRLQEDEHVGITFDLYDVGLMFFDKSKIKQHYIVNF
jgi:hypothetical protein